MPCTSDYHGEDVERLDEELDKATQAACELARVLRERLSMLQHGEKHLWKSLLSKKTRIWVKKHDEADARRIQAEKAQKKLDKIRNVAWNKLTHEERVALGLKS